MFGSDSDSDDGGDRAATTANSRGTMKSIFASDRKQAATGDRSLKFEPPKRDKITEAVTGSGKAVEPGSAPAPGAGQSAAAATAAVIAYRGDQQVGPAMVAVTVSAQGQAAIILIDKERRPLAKIRVDESLQLLPSADEPQYATMYDPIAQLHWMLLFKSVTDSHTFVASALTVQHYLLLPDGPRSPVIDLVEGPVDEFGRPKPAKRGDDVVISQLVWKIKRVGATFAVDKLIEEIVMEAPRKIELGQHTLMLGVEDALVGCRPGTWRLVIVPPKKTKTSGLGNPEVGPKDTVVAIVRLHSIDRLEGEDEFPKDGPAHAPADTLAIEDRNGGRPSTAKQQQQQQQDSPPPQQQQMMSPQREEDSLLKALLLQTVQMQQQQFQAMQMQHQPPPPQAPPPPAAAANPDAAVPAHVERSLDRINQQLSALYEKIDRLDFEKRLEQNNDKLERVIKKAVGKMPVNDVDIEDMSKDKEALLARIEQLKEKLDEATERYHQALHEYGEKKEQHASAINDLAIERSTNEKSLIDLRERHRLQIVEAEVRLRSAVDDAREKAFEDGREVGYADGFQAGKIDAMTGDSADSSVERLKQMISAKDQELVNLQSRCSELERRMYEDRRLATDEKNALQGLVERLETKERQRQGVVYDHATAVAKKIRTVMNATYANFEAQLYATESASVDVQDALNMALVAVKSEARLATDELKREAASRAMEPAHDAARNEAGRRAVPDPGEASAGAPPPPSRRRGNSSSYDEEGGGYDSAGSAGSSVQPRSNASAAGAVAAYSRAAAAHAHYDPTADDSEASTSVRYGVRARGGMDAAEQQQAAAESSDRGYESSSQRQPAASPSSAVAAATYNYHAHYDPTDYDSETPEVPDDVRDAIREHQAARTAGTTTYAGALASAYAMPSGDEPAADELADEDEIAAYLAARTGSEDAVDGADE